MGEEKGSLRPAEDSPREAYDVAILGGGLAGLTLGLQIHQARPGTSILVAEKREGPAPEAAFKVGESTVELAANYYAEVIGMKDHLEADNLPKMGLRYFMPAGDNSDLAQRVENGPPFFPPVPSFQLDRGRFENELARRNLAAGIDLFDGARVGDIELAEDVHRVTVARGDRSHTVSARWLVDATGRAFTLKRKLGLEKGNGHDMNSSWFRLAGGLDYEQWVKDDPEWFERITEQGVRHFSTTHLVGQGYWVWLIPLASGPVSIGIVADPRFHPYERISSLEGALEWIREHEPQLSGALEDRRSDVEDFLTIENFSYSSERMFSADRWCLVGEAGVFLDPFYSPGSDFIAISNTLTTDLVTRSLDGEDIAARAEAHQDLFMAHYDGYLPLFEGQYELWGNPEAMTAKIASNFVYYWASITPLFFQRKLADVEFMATVRDDCDRIALLNAAVERVCLSWHRLVDREWRRGYISIGQFPYLAFLHLALPQPLEDDALREKIAQNRRVMEAIAVIIFHKAAVALGSQAPDEEARIDPYAISLEPGAWETAPLFTDSGLTLSEARATAEGFENILVDAVAEPAADLAGYSARVSTEPTAAAIPPHVLDYIGEKRTFTLATASPGGIPHAGTFLYVNEGGRLYFWTKPQTTIAKHVEQNPVVAFTIDEYSEDLRQTRGVQGNGECSVVLSGEEIARAADLFGQKFPDLSPGATMSISFFRVVPKELQFIDNTSATDDRQGGVFGAEFHTERAYSVFADLPIQRLESIAAQMGTLTADAGEVIVRRGGPADKFFIVVDGEVEVIQDESAAGITLGPGHFFGETAIMLDRPRSATVRATKPTTLLSLDRDAFRDLVAQSLGTTGEFDRVIQARLSAMAGEA